MTITQLSYVLAVAEHRNFTKAAKKCYVTQPTLSMQIQKLEDELDIQIFDRNKKPIKLTDAGEKIVIQARNIVNESYRIQDIVDQQKGFIGGDFKLGIIPTIIPTLLPMFLKTFINKHPKVKLKIEELTTEEIISRLKDGRLDAAIAATPLEDDTIKERILYYEPFVAYIPEGHRLSNKKSIDVSDLDLDDILLLQDGHCFKDSIINLCSVLKNRTNERFQLESGSIEALIKLSHEGLGMTLLPYLHTLEISSEEGKNNLKTFNDPKPSRQVSIIYPKSELKMQIIEVLESEILSATRGAIAFNHVDIISPLLKK